MLTDRFFSVPLDHQRPDGEQIEVFAREVAATAQAIRGLQAWVTSEYEHDGLRISNGAVLDRLIGMARGNI